MMEHDAIVQCYRALFILLDWQVLPDPVPDPSRPGKRPHPESASINTFLIKIPEGYEYRSQLRTFLVEHPFLVLELDLRPVLNRDLPYGFDVQRTMPTSAGRLPLHVTADAVYDAWYTSQTYAHRGGIAAIALNGHGYEKVPRDRDGVPWCARGLRMHPTYPFQHTNGYRAQRYRCPLLFPQHTGETCTHEQFLKDKGCVKDINIEKGGLMRAMLDRSSPLYRAVYRQRTSAERINSQAKARCIERPKVRQGDSVKRLNTLTYLVINVKALARARAINASLLMPNWMPGSLLAVG